MKLPTITLNNGDVEVLMSVVDTWCRRNHIDPESERASAVTATAVDLMEAGFRTHESLSVALANALAV